jgi:hypothetical protein
MQQAGVSEDRGDATGTNELRPMNSDRSSNARLPSAVVLNAIASTLRLTNIKYGSRGTRYTSHESPPCTAYR